MKNSESKKQDSNSPLIIFIGEQHDNMAYGSLIEQIVKDCKDKGLKIQVFSEFKSQTQKIEIETSLGESLRNQLTDYKDHEANVKFLDDCFIKMGDLDEREKIMAESLKKYQEQGLTPRQLYEQTKGQMVVAPEIYGMMESQLQEGEKTGFLNKGLLSEKPFNLENFYHDFRAQFNHQAVHGAMLADLRAAKVPDTDVVIVVSGLGHTYGLNEELTEFDGYQKFVITNFLDRIPLEEMSLETKKRIRAEDSSAQIGIGGLLEFDVDPVTKEATIPEAVGLAIDARSQAKNKTYDKGLDPTTKEFTNYINGSKDWANIGKEIKYFIGLLDSENEFERVDAKGYVLTCMFKILGAIDEFDSKKIDKDGKLIRPDDPRKDIDPSVQDFLGGDLSKEAIRLKTLQYSREIIEKHGEEKTAPALSSVASAYGVRAYMQHSGLLTEEEARPKEEPQKYHQAITDSKLSENTRKNIALAMEKFEESANLGNVRSMGSVVYWAEICKHPELQELNEKWTKEAATANTPNPNSQIDYAKMLESKGDYKGAEKMLRSAVDFGLDKALKAFHKKQKDAELKGEEKQPQVQAGNLNATQEQELGNAPVKKTIAIFAPSRGSDDPKYLAEIEKQKDFIKSSGFDVDCPDDLIKPPIKGDWHNEWANTKEERARRIINILNNPEVGTMWATNGGESAIEVVNLLDEYDKNPEEIKRQIVDSYLKTHPELPENFFLPERRDLFDYSKGALPKRGIYCVGMSDVSGINNFLGQRGIISPLYADGLLFPDIKRSEDILKTLSDEKKTSEYSGLTLLSEGEFVSKEPLEVYATVDGWIASSCGTNFQFALQKPSILAVESIEEGNVVGLTLQQAFEAGALENVKAIAIGRIKGGQVGGDLEKYPALKEFVEKSGIAVFTTNGNLKTGENTFGHGRGGITEPFTNFANTSLTKQENGSYSLKISGSRSQENLDFYYQSRESAANKVKVFSDHKKTNGNISIKSKSLQTLSGNGKQELNGSEIIHANYRELRLTNGTERQINLNDKVLLVSGNDGSDGELSFLHQSLVENHLSGSLSGAKAVIIAIPFYPKLSTVGTLKTMTDPNIPYEIDEQGNYLINSLHKRVYDNFLKNDLDKIGSDALKYGFESKGFDEKGDEIGVVKIIIQDEARIEEARRDRYENHLDLFREMFADAASSYLPNTPVYLASDDKLVKNVNEGIGSGKLLVTEKSIAEKSDAFQKQRIDMEFAEEKEFKESKKPQISLDALDLVTLQKPSPSPKKSYVEKMVGTSKDGYHEI